MRSGLRKLKVFAKCGKESKHFGAKGRVRARFRGCIVSVGAKDMEAE